MTLFKERLLTPVTQKTMNTVPTKRSAYGVSLILGYCSEKKNMGNRTEMKQHFSSREFRITIF